MQLEFNIQLQSDEELIYKSGGDPPLVVVTKFLLWFLNYHQNTQCMINMFHHF